MRLSLARGIHCLKLDGTQTLGELALWHMCHHRRIDLRDALRIRAARGTKGCNRIGDFLATSLRILDDIRIGPQRTHDRSKLIAQTIVEIHQ
ncbi:hypothetical protein DID98_02835 [Burkholderia sp. Bp8984]|nr:hypothetical protein DID98_02835 [Burkholderia sp. Bp8984]